jgi:hypothetical protein
MRRIHRLLSLSLSLIAVVVATAPAEAVKVILERQMNISAEGEFLGYLDFDQRVLNALMFETIAEYHRCRIGAGH